MIQLTQNFVCRRITPTTNYSFRLVDALGARNILANIFSNLLNVFLCTRTTNLPETPGKFRLFVDSPLRPHQTGALTGYEPARGDKYDSSPNSIEDI